MNTRTRLDGSSAHRCTNNFFLSKKQTILPPCRSLSTRNIAQTPTYNINQNQHERKSEPLATTYIASVWRYTSVWGAKSLFGEENPPEKTHS